MLRGSPGAGKTLLGVHFLVAGAERGEDVLFINLGEAEADVRANAEAFGFDLEDVAFLDLSPSSEFFVEGRSYEIFSADDVEGEGVTEEITAEVEAHDPDRVFVDPLTQLRYLTRDEFQFRKQVLSFLRFLKEQGATVCFTSQNTDDTPDDDLQFMADAIVHLDSASRGRTLEVSKFRGSDFQGGTHAVVIDDDGMSVYPELLPDDRSGGFRDEDLSSGVPAFDRLLDGGIQAGTVTLISGPSGVGKTTTGAQFVKEAAGRGDRSVIYLFDEAREIFLHRCEAINIPVRKMIDRGTLTVTDVEALEYSPQRFAADVRSEVESEETDIVMIDGIEGYRLSVRGGDDELTQRLHALGNYLRNRGVSTVFTSEVGNITGDFEASDHDVSYLADNIVFLRYIEIDGELRKAIGVLKMRASDFERTLREFRITEHGITVGDPLTGLRGVLSGTPEWVDGETGSGRR
jgi:circadian clock protein KaiC